MRLPGTRLIVPELAGAGENILLSGEEAAHARARRIKRGDRVILFDGSGREALGRVARLSADQLEVSIEEIRPAALAGPSLALLIAGIRAELLAWIAEKATELGAGRIVIVRTERTQSFRAAPGLLPRLTRVARAAAKQSGRAAWPEIEGPVPLSEALSLERSSSRIFLDFEGRPFPSSLPQAPAALLVGPEGGWSEEERGAARAKGWLPASLPAGTLRAETAAIAGLVLLRAALAGR